MEIDPGGSQGPPPRAEAPKRIAIESRMVAPHESAHRRATQLKVLTDLLDYLFGGRRFETAAIAANARIAQGRVPRAEHVAGRPVKRRRVVEHRLFGQGLSCRSRSTMRRMTVSRDISSTPAWHRENILLAGPSQPSALRLRKLVGQPCRRDGVAPAAEDTGRHPRKSSARQAGEQGQASDISILNRLDNALGRPFPLL